MVGLRQRRARASLLTRKSLARPSAERPRTSIEPATRTRNAASELALARRCGATENTADNSAETKVSEGKGLDLYKHGQHEQRPDTQNTIQSLRIITVQPPPA